ncbi:hypothetical protein BJY52DRAFT_1184543 [Lactarius psammicola]|nr:hypothetical protein BJY52DRAFT_1184543 [Lactarius psammicola]
MDSLNHLNLNGAPTCPRPPQIPLHKPTEDVRVYNGHDRYTRPDFVSKHPSPLRVSNAGAVSLVGPRPPSPPPPAPSLPSPALSPAPSLPSPALSPAPSPTSTSPVPLVEVSPPAPRKIAAVLVITAPFGGPARATMAEAMRRTGGSAEARHFRTARR